jgi:pantoate kinase
MSKGITTEVTVSEAETSRVRIFINKREAQEAETTRTVAEMMLKRAAKPYDVAIEHEVQIPIGAGFGSSAAGALTAGLALAKALNLQLTYNQIGRIAHVAEVQCKTGLGTVGPLMLGGCVLTLEPGAPGLAVIDRIPLPPDYVIVAGVFDSRPTKAVLSSPGKREAVNRWGGRTLEAILAEPSVENLLAQSLEFAERAGFMSQRLRELVDLAENAGAIGAAQNMVGEAVHALTRPENAATVIQAFKQVLPEERIISAEIDLQGARLLGMTGK